MKTKQPLEIINYIELPRKRSSLVKIDEVLEERIRAFKRAKQIRRFTFTKQV